MDKFTNWVDHILAFIFCIAIPFYGARQRKGFSNIHFSSEQKKRIYISGSFSLFILGAVVMLVWLIFKRPLPELGLTRPRNIQSWWWLVIVFALVYLFDTVITLSSKKGVDKTIDNWKKRTPFLPTKKSELPEYLLLCFNAGVFEEIVYRGYLINYCWYLFDGYAYQQEFSVFLPALVFSIAHFYQGGKAVIKGTRIGVDLILEKIGAGETIEELLKAYPFLQKEAILACVSYGAASVRNETLIDVE